MIIERINNQIKPSVSNMILVTPDPSGSDSKLGATRGKTTQLKIAIGKVARTQIPRILTRLYWSFVLNASWDGFAVIISLLL